jgi:hypothetical protein
MSGGDEVVEDEGGGATLWLGFAQVACAGDDPSENPNPVASFLYNLLASHGRVLLQLVVVILTFFFFNTKICNSLVYLIKKRTSIGSLVFHHAI